MATPNRAPKKNLRCEPAKTADATNQNRVSVPNKTAWCIPAAGPTRRRSSPLAHTLIRTIYFVPGAVVKPLTETSTFDYQRRERSPKNATAPLDRGGIEEVRFYLANVRVRRKARRPLLILILPHHPPVPQPPSSREHQTDQNSGRSSPARTRRGTSRGSMQQSSITIHAREVFHHTVFSSPSRHHPLFTVTLTSAVFCGGANARPLPPESGGAVPLRSRSLTLNDLSRRPITASDTVPKRRNELFR